MTTILHKNFYKRWRKFFFKKNEKFLKNHLFLCINKILVIFNSVKLDIYEKKSCFSNSLDKFLNVSGKKNFYEIYLQFFLKNYYTEIELLPIGKGNFSSSIFSGVETESNAYLLGADFKLKFRLEKINFKNFFIKKKEKTKKGNTTSLLFSYFNYNVIDSILRKKFFTLKKKCKFVQTVLLYFFFFSTKRKHSKIFDNGQLKRLLISFPIFEKFFFENILQGFSVVRNNFGPEFRYYDIQKLV
ncbi:hypothetical protein CMESO_480 (nucleomorph) [Chroomonas mesostigmatica CCMP1168]|uniref:Uncharacterized protein n=1 Tax=Chroomonas mesostigmatica CCMP1168 TaxID=1195612 RepID=J7GB39_9CRYP|nr:hypothetical protein CMESO_480 [Chroomonas mesostigmatica CCMP1168]|mmetsp:Transcript_58814/g.144181  ORF Transcript_58814/g.144181 Transcript_58814/m.144181 type:complete len:243 (-) Transcript_58814:1311-2039(-)